MQIDNNLSELSSILDNLLPWVSAQIKDQDLNKSATGLRKIVDDCIDEISQIVRDKEISLINQCDDGHVARIDIESIRNVLRNILKNAIKFSNEGGKIYVQTIKKRDSIELVVKDEGVGMSKESQQKIFVEYASADGTSGEKGHGLGLKLSKDLVISNGGTINVMSQLGEGTTVVVDLPKS